MPSVGKREGSQNQTASKDDRGPRGYPDDIGRTHLADLGSVVPFERVEEALDHALSRRLTTIDRLEAFCETTAVEGGAVTGPCVV